MKKYKFPFNGKFGNFGGKYIPETLVPAIEELEESYKKFRKDLDFQKELKEYLENYAGRPTPIYLAKNLTKYAGGAKIYLKREDLLHGGAHKTNNTLGQCLLAKKMGKKESSLRLGQVNMELVQPLHQQFLGLNVKSIWA